MRTGRAETLRNYVAAVAALFAAPGTPEPSNRVLQVTDKRRRPWQNRLILNKKGSFEVSLS
jgi:hypothetical protein